MANKRTVLQAVFDSPSALRIAREATRQAIDELNAKPPHMLDPGNPNHPFHDGLFGQDRKTFIRRQYR